MARPQPQPSLAKAPTKEHPLAPDPVPEPALKSTSKSAPKSTPAGSPAAETSVMFSTRLNADLRRQLKVHAAERDQTIQEVTEEAIRAYLSKVEKR